MKLRSTLFFAAASLSASALLPVAATTSAFFAASAVPAQAENVTLTQNGYTNLGGTDQTGTGNTYTYDGGEDDKVGSWIGWTAENANTHADVAFSGTLSGDGLIGFYVRNGNGTGYTVNRIDLSGISAESFTGRLTAVNPWADNVFVNVGGTALSNTEFAFAGLGYEEESWKYKRGTQNSDRGNDTLYVATGGATLAGVSGTSQGFASGEWQFNAHEFILAETAGAVLTLAGSGDYAFYGTVGASNSRVGVSVTDGTTQTFGGSSNFLAAVTIEEGSTLKVGTGSITGAITGTGTLEKVGSGRLEIYHRDGNAAHISEFTGKIKVSEGTLLYTLPYNDSTLNANLEIAAGATFADSPIWKLSLTVAGELSGAGTLALGAPEGENQGDGFREVRINGNTANFTGEWQLATASSTAAGNRRVNGILNSADGVFGGVVSFVDSGSDATKTSAKLSLAKDMTIGGLKGDLTAVSVESTDSAASRALTISLAEGADLAYAGTIASSISSLTITGAGTQTLSGSVAAGSVVVSGGTLVFDGSASIATGGSGALFTVSGGTLNFGDNAQLALTGTGNLSSFTLYTATGGTVDISALDYSNFTWNGEALSSRAEISNADGVLTFTNTEFLNLIWAGTDNNNVWNQDDEANTIWTVNGSEGSNYFAEGDSATFDGTAETSTVVVGSDVSAGTITVSSATTFNAATGGAYTVTSNTLNATAGITIGEGVTWALAGQQATGENSLLSKFSGAGTVSFATSTDYGNVLKFADGFTGTAHMTAGNFTINESKFGSTLVLGDGVNFQLTGGSSVQIGGESADTGWTHVAGSEIVLEGTSQIHQNSGANLTINADVSGSGTYDSRGGGALIFNGNVELGGFIATRSGNGATTFTGAQNTIGDLRFGQATVNFGTENASAGTGISSVTTVGSIVMGHTNNAGTLNVRADAALTVTGSSMSTGGSAGSFMIGNYPQAQTVNVSGALNLQNAGITTRDGTGTVNILEGGEVNFNVGLTTASNNSGAARATVVLESGGRMNIGSGGITESTTLGLTLNGGTIGSLADSWSSSRAMTLGGNVTFDTTLMEFNASGKATETENGSSVTLSGVLGGSGTLVKTGEGTLTLSGANTLTGTLEVREGTLAAVSAGALGAGDVVVAGGTLEISGGTVNLVSGQRLTLESGEVSVASGTNFVVAGTLELGSAIDVAGSVSFSDSVRFVLDWDLDGEATQNFKLFSLGAGVTLDASWENLGVNNVLVENTSLRGADVDFNTDGSVSVTLDAAKPIKLIWTGKASDVWFDEGNWVTEDGKTESFYARDSAVFNGPASVEVSGAGVSAGTVEINAGEGGTVSFSGGQVMAEEGFTVNSGTLKLTANDNIAGDVTVNAGGVLDLNGQSADISENGLEKLTLNGGSLLNNGGSVGASYAQITSVALTADSAVGGSGDFGIIAGGYAATSLDLGGHTLTKIGENTFYLYNTSVTAGTLAVDEGTVAMTVSKGEVDFAANVNVADSASFTFNMTGGSTTFSGSVDIAGTTTVSGGTLNFSGNADISALTVSGGAANFSGGGNVGPLTFNGGGGNVAFNGAAGTTYTLGAVALDATTSYTRNFSVGEGVTVNATSLANRWGMGALTVNGELNFSGDLKFATGNNNSTENNVIAGTGTLRVNSLTFGNVGVYNISVDRIEVGFGGIIYDDNGGNNGVPTVNLGATTIAATESWSNGYGDDAVTPRLTLVSERETDENGVLSGGTFFEVVGADTAAEIEAEIRGEGTLVKTGEGTLTLSGALSHTGGTTVEAGTLQLLLGGDYASGDISVASGATLQLSSAGDAVDFGGTADAPVTLTLGEGSVLSVGEGTVNLTAGTTLAFTGADGAAVDASEATLTYRSGEGGGTLIFADDRELGAFVFDSQGTVSSASVGKSATLSAGELSFAASANRAAEMSGAGTLAVGKISVNNTRSGNEISVGTLELTQAESEISVARNGSLEISSEEIVFSEGVEDGTLVKTGAGTLTVGDAFQDDFAGSLRVDAGTVSTNLLNLSGALTLAAGTTFDGSVDASAGSSVGLGAGARIDGDLTLTDATATLGEATVTGDLTVSGSEMTFNGTVSGIGTLTWGDGNGINLGEAFRAEISSAGNGVLLDFNVGLDGDGNPLTEDFDFEFDASALAESFLGRDVDLVYNEKDTSIEIVVTGALVWNETVAHWTVSGTGGAGYEHDQWDVVTRDGVSEESAFFENGDFVQFTTAGSTRLVGTVNGGSSFAGKGTEPLGDGIVRTAGIVFDIEGGGTFTLDSKKRYNGDGELVDDGQSVLNSTAQGKDEGITVLSGNVTIGKNVDNNLVGGTKIYGGSLTVYAADALGNGAIEVGDAASATRATLTFAHSEGTLNVARTITVGNANAQIGVTNAAAVVSLDRVVKNAAAEEGAALTKLGAGTLNVGRGDYEDAELLDRVAVNAGTLTFTGDAGELPTRNVSVASGATLNVEHGGDAVAFDAMDVAGTVSVGTAQDASRAFSAGTISATGTGGKISGALQLDGASFEAETAGAATTYKGTLFYAEDADQNLAFTGTVSAAADSEAALYKAGAGTVSFASGTTERFRLDADLVLDGGTVSFGEGVAASGELRVTGGNTRIEVSRTSGTPADGRSSFSDLNVAAGAGVTFALGNGMWTTDSVSGANIGLTLSGEIAAENGSVAFASTGGSSTLRGTVGIENAESATFGLLTVGGTRTNIVDLSVGNGVKEFSADAVALYGASSLNFANLQEGKATIGALQVIDNAGNAAKLDLGGGTLSLENDGNVAVLYGDGTLRISNGTLNVSGQNYSAEHTPGIVLVDGATFNFDVAADDGAAYSSLREITTEGSGGTVSKSGAGTLVLYLDDETGQPVAGDITFAGDVKLAEGETHLYATLADAELSVDDDATLRLFTTAKTADGENAPEGASRLARTISGAGTIAVSGVLHANGGLENFTGALHANGGMIVAYEALSGAATAGGNDAFAGSIRLSDGGVLAAAENVTIAKVDVDGQNTFTSVKGASLTVKEVAARAGTSLTLDGAGTLENAAFAAPAEGETATKNSISVSGDWTLAGAATGVDSVFVDGALTLGTGSALDADAELSVNAGGTLTLEKAETYANKISLNGGTVAADAGAGQTVSLTNVSADAGSVFSAESGTLSVSAANLGDGASALRFDAAEEAVVQLDVGGAWTLDGAISGAGTFEKAGAGTLTLDSGSHDVANIAVSAGTLSVGADAAFSGTGTLTVADGAKLESDDGQLSGFTLTGEGTATVSGALGGIENAEDVTLDGALSVSGNVSGSALAFKDGASLKGAGTTVSGTRLSGGTITLETLTVAGDSTFDEGVSTLKLQGQAGTSGAVNAAFSGSIEKSGDGTWTVSNYTYATDKTLNVVAGTLVWKNAKFAGDSTITADDSRITVDGTLRIEGAETGTLGGTIGGTGTLELRNTDATLDIEAASGASWTLNITGTSDVTVNAALPGALRVGDEATAWLNLKEKATLQGQLNIASSGATLVKTGAGKLIVETSSATTPHNIFGTLRVEEGAVSQKTAMSWMNNSVLDIGEKGTFIVDLGGAAAKSNAQLTGTGTLEIKSTGADGYTLEGSVKEFEGTVSVADGATLNLRNGVFAAGAAVTVEEGGVLAFMGREGGEISGVSGAGTLRVDMTVTPGADSSYLTGAYVYGDNAGFEGSVEVKSGILSVSAEDFATLAGRTLSVGGDGSAAALYVDDGLSAGGVAQGAFLRLSGGGDLNGAFDGFESRVKENGGVLLSGGSFSASSDFGSATAEGQLYVAEKGAQLALSGGASVGGSLFVASGAELVLGAAAASSASAAGTQTFAAEDAGTVLPDGVSGVSGDFTLNGKLTCLVTDATNLSAPLLAVAGTTTVNTAANKKAFKPEIVLDVGGFSGSLEGLTIVDSGEGVVSGAGSINQYVSVTDSAGGKWVVVKNPDGSLALSSGTQDGYGVSGNMSGLFNALYSEEEGSFFQKELSDKQGGELTSALVSLSPVSFGSLIEMQSGFASLENDLLRERLEQRRYERTFASDRSTKFKPFVNILGADREGDGDGTDAANYDITHAGAIGGFDFAVSDNTIVGVSIGVDWAKADLKDGAGKHEGEGSRIGVYGMTVFENAYVGYGLSAGGMSFDTKRRFGDRTMTGDTDGNDVNATLLFGAGWTLSDAYGIDLAPYVGLDIGYVTADAFTESGSAETALDTESIDRWSLRGKIGATLSWRATERLRIGLDAMFAHEFGDSDIDIDAKIGGNAFSSKAYLMDENTIQIGPRIDFRIDDTWSVSAAYAFETDLDETTTHSANLGVRARF